MTPASEGEPKCLTCEGPVEGAHVVCDRCVDLWLAKNRTARSEARRQMRDAAARDLLEYL